MKKHKDLQPWLDYFKMLRTYEEKGYLEILPEKHEAYITRAALLTLGKPSSLELATNGIFAYVMYRAAHDEGLKYYDAAMRVNPEGPASDKPSWMTDKLMSHARAVTEELKGSTFAIHIVKEEHPYDLLYTLLLTKKRTARTLWLRESDHIELIDYREK